MAMVNGISTVRVSMVMDMVSVRVSCSAVQCLG